MFCSKCGKEIPDDSKVCAYCGAQVQVQAEGQPYNTTQPNNQPYNTVQPSNQPYHAASPNNQPYNGQPNNQPYNGQPNNQPYNGQPNNRQYYNGQPNNQQYYNGQPNNQQYYNGQPNNMMSANKSLKPDNKFNLAAAFFTWIWALFKGMWDLALLDFFISFLFFIPVAGQIFAVLYLIFRIAIVGRNANYYYRLKVTMGIPMYKAIMDPNLRRL